MIRILVALLVMTHASVAAPQLQIMAPRVMSLNLCADAYLMAIADKAQIVALTPQSRDPALSAFTRQAADYPSSEGRIEDIIALRPDIVIVSAYSDPLRNALIRKLGFTLLVMDAADKFDAARADIIALGTAIGRAKQAAAYLAKLDAALLAARAGVGATTKRPRILPLQRRNLTVGSGHGLDEIITLSGADNLGRRLTDGAMGRVTLETAIAAKADYILLNENAAQPDSRGPNRRGPDSRGMEFLAHPALQRSYSVRQHLYIDNNLLVCAGATTPRAVAALVAQLKASRD